MDKDFDFDGWIWSPSGSQLARYLTIKSLIKSLQVEKSKWVKEDRTLDKIGEDQMSHGELDTWYKIRRKVQVNYEGLDTWQITKV